MHTIAIISLTIIALIIMHVIRADLISTLSRIARYQSRSENTTYSAFLHRFCCKHLQIRVTKRKIDGAYIIQLAIPLIPWYIARTEESMEDVNNAIETMIVNMFDFDIINMFDFDDADHVFTTSIKEYIAHQTNEENE